MKTVKFNNGEIRTVTTRHADILISKKEATEVIATKEEKKVIKNKGSKK